MAWKSLDRRRFLAASAAALGGVIATDAWGQMCGGGGCGATSFGGQVAATGSAGATDPPRGAPLRDPVDMPLKRVGRNVVEGQLDVTPARVEINGVPANLYTYNGVFPGPTIRVRKGERLRLQFRNNLPVTAQTDMHGTIVTTTNLHTHGFHVSPSGNSDNMMVQVKPGAQFLYEYDTAKHEPGVLNFYHPHVHGLVAEQYWAGMAGALVVEDEDEALDDYETHILVLKDMSLVGADPAPHTPMDWMMGKEGALVMVNGQLNPVLTIRPGQVQRWRFVNASNARFYNLSLENHSLQLIGTDGSLLDQPHPVSSVLLAPGERIDTLVKIDKSGTFRLLSLPYNRGGHMGGMMMGGGMMGMGGMGGAGSLAGTGTTVGGMGMGGMDMGGSGMAAADAATTMGQMAEMGVTGGMSGGAMVGGAMSGGAMGGGMLPRGPGAGMMGGGMMGGGMMGGRGRGMMGGGMMGGGMMGGMSGAQVTLLTVSCAGTSRPQDIPTRINPAVQRLALDVSSLPRRRLVLSMTMSEAYINGVRFGDVACTVNSKLGTYEVWDIVNQSPMDHPFHQHVNAAQVLSIQGGDPAYASLYTSLPAWKDVVIVPRMGSVTLLVPALDFTGMAMFHCHIIEHEDLGMMGIWNIA